MSDHETVTMTRGEYDRVFAVVTAADYLARFGCGSGAVLLLKLALAHFKWHGGSAHEEVYAEDGLTAMLEKMTEQPSAAN